MRGTRMLKFKKTLETLDLVLVGAEYGEGRKSAIFSRFFFAAWDEARTKLTTLGKVSTGLTDEDTKTLNERLAHLIIQEKGQEGRQVTITPQLVCEILADEILESPRFEAGYALRFARIVRIREDLGIDDGDDICKVKNLFLAQRSRKKNQ
jgi:DNA ligase-1